MLTKNGKFMFANTITSQRTYKGVDGNSISLTLGNKAYGAIWAGSGTTPPSVDDYCIESRLTALSALGGSITLSDSIEKNYIMLLTETFTNATSEDITVNELGWVCGSGYTQAETSGALLVREVIDPVVIPAGESKTFTIRIG